MKIILIILLVLVCLVIEVVYFRKLQAINRQIKKDIEYKKRLIQDLRTSLFKV